MRLTSSAIPWQGPTKLTKEASDELTAEAKDEPAVLREKAKGRRPRKEEIDPIIADLQRLTGWSEATVVNRLNLSKKKTNLLVLHGVPSAIRLGYSPQRALL